MSKPFLISLVLIALPAKVWPQALVQDSLVLNLQPAPLDSIRGCRNIKAVHDRRPVDDPRLVGIDEVTRLQFIPVDRYIKTIAPLIDLVRESLPAADDSVQPSFTVGLDQLELSNRSFLLLFKQYRINSLLTLYHNSTGDSTTAQGQLVFDCSKTDLAFGSKPEKGYESVFNLWLSQVARDVPVTTLNLGDDPTLIPDNFRPFKANFSWMQLFASADLLVSGQGYLVDGQLHFDYPEARRLSVQSVRVTRFRHDKKFDSIEYGLVNIGLHYRLNQACRLQVQSDLLLGINRWNDMDVVDHELADALIGDFSVHETLCYHPISRKTPLFGFGLFQDLNYIDSYGFNFHFGLLLKVGVQL